MKSTGVAGRPEEYFEARPDTGRPPHPGEYLDGVPPTGAGIRSNETPPDVPSYSDLRGIRSYQEHLDRTFALGTTDNGVFATKLMWRNVADVQVLASELPQYSGLEPPEFLRRLLGDPSYVWMRRRDTARQAISLWRALQTRAWRSEHGVHEDESQSLVYNPEAIHHLVSFLQSEDDSWSRYFEAAGVTPLAIYYEDDLEQRRAETIGRILAHVGISRPSDWLPAEPLARQADDINDEWYAAYHRDSAAGLVPR